MNDDERRYVRDLFHTDEPIPDDIAVPWDEIRAMNEDARRAAGKWTAALDPPYDTDGLPIHPGVTPNQTHYAVLAVHLEAVGKTPADVPYLRVIDPEGLFATDTKE